MGVFRAPNDQIDESEYEEQENAVKEDLQRIADLLIWPKSPKTDRVLKLEVPAEPFVYLPNSDAKNVEGISLSEWPPSIDMIPYTQLRSVEVRLDLCAPSNKIEMDTSVLPKSVSRLTVVLSAKSRVDKLVISASRAFEGVMIDASGRKKEVVLSGSLFTAGRIATLSMHNALFETDDAATQVSSLQWTSDTKTLSQSCVWRAMRDSTLLKEIFVTGGSHRWESPTPPPSTSSTLTPTVSVMTTAASQDFKDHKHSQSPQTPVQATKPFEVTVGVQTIDFQNSEWASHGFVHSGLYRHRSLASLQTIKMHLSRIEAVSHEDLVAFATHLLLNLSHRSLTYVLIRMGPQYELYARVLFGAVALKRASIPVLAKIHPNLTLEMPRNEDMAVSIEYMRLLEEWVTKLPPVDTVMLMGSSGPSPAVAAAALANARGTARADLKTMHDKLLGDANLRFTVQNTQKGRRSMTIVCMNTSGAVTFVA